MILEYSTLKSTVVRYNSWHMGLARSEQASVPDWRRERGEMVAMKDHQTQEAEGELQFHSRLTWVARGLVPCWNQRHICTFES